MNQVTDTDWGRSQPPGEELPPPSGPGVLSSIGRHGCLVFAVTLVWCLAAAVHVTLAPREYTSTVKLSAEPAAARALAGEDRSAARTPAWLAQQCEVIRSAPLLQEAALRLSPQDQADLAGEGGAVERLKRDLDVSVSRKDEVITIGLESPSPRRSEGVVAAVAGAYLDQRGRQQQEAAGNTLRVLQKELAAREAERADRQEALVEFGRKAGLTLALEKTDPILQQYRRLSEALTEAELASLAAQADLGAMEALADDPAQLRAFAAAQGWLDRLAAAEASPAALVAERDRLEAQLASLRQGLTDEHPAVREVQARLGSVASELAEQAGGQAQRYLGAARQRLQAAQSREAGIRRSLQRQQEATRQSGADLARYALLQADVQQSLRLCEVLRGRVMETGAALASGALDMRVLEPVYTSPRPTSPKTAQDLALAGGAGLLAGSLLALLRDRRRGRACRPPVSRRRWRLASARDVPPVPARAAGAPAAEETADREAAAALGRTR